MNAAPIGIILAQEAYFNRVSAASVSFGRLSSVRITDEQRKRFQSAGKKENMLPCSRAPGMQRGATMAEAMRGFFPRIRIAFFRIAGIIKS
jgi:hypothetical protein